MGVVIGLTIAVIVTGVIVAWSFGAFDKNKDGKTNMDDFDDYFGM